MKMIAPAQRGENTTRGQVGVRQRPVTPDTRGRQVISVTTTYPVDLDVEMKLKCCPAVTAKYSGVAALAEDVRKLKAPGPPVDLRKTLRSECWIAEFPLLAQSGHAELHCEMSAYDPADIMAWNFSF